MKNWALPLSLTVAIAGCTTAPRTIELPVATPPEIPVEEAEIDPAASAGADTAPSGPEVFAAADARLASMSVRIYENGDAVPYSEFWSAYLDSSKIHSAVADRENFRLAVERFQEEEARRETGECGDFDWGKWTRQNFFELEPHLAAQDCYEQLGETEKAERHARAVQYILNGVLGSGDGESFDTAYEIGILDHAEDILRLAGYRLMDSYLMPIRNGQGLYYVLQVVDPDSGIQRNIRFENQRAIHRIMGVNYPFAGLNDLYITGMLEPMTEHSTAAQIGMGSHRESSGEPEKAVSSFMDAAAYGSRVAQYRLGRLCLVHEDLAMFSRGDCVDFLLSAAEQEHTEAMITLAYVYREGLGVEADEELARQFFQAAEQRLEPGMAWLRYANHYAGDKLVVDAGVELAYLRKAAALGQLDARYALLGRDRGGQGPVDAEKLLPELRAIAEQGHTPARVAYARLVLTNAGDYGEEERASAREFLDAALAVNARSAHSLQGNLLRAGPLGQRDFAGAENHFMQSPLHTGSQIGMGRLHGQQRLPDSDPQLAAAWYMMCASREVPECLYQMGRLFRNGEGVRRDPSLAVAMFAQAARKGHRLAMAEVEKMSQE